MPSSRICTLCVSPGSRGPQLGQTRYVLEAVVLICGAGSPVVSAPVRRGRGTRDALHPHRTHLEGDSLRRMRVEQRESQGGVLPGVCRELQCMGRALQLRRHGHDRDAAGGPPFREAQARARAVRPDVALCTAWLIQTVQRQACIAFYNPSRGEGLRALKGTYDVARSMWNSIITIDMFP